MVKQRIELLSPELFRTRKEDVEQVELLQKMLRFEVGWHYILDLAWLLRELREVPPRSLVLDAGAGMGLAQFIALDLGMDVLSVDFVNRSVNRKFVKERYGEHIHFANDQSKEFRSAYIEHLESTYSLSGSADPDAKNGTKQTDGGLADFIRSQREKPEGRLASFVRRIIGRSGEGPSGFPQASPANIGQLFLMKGDLSDLAEIPDNFVDAVISVSALEHNDAAAAGKCVNELLRVCKPGGKLAITVSATEGEDWHHDPSKGWCFSEQTLKRIFQLDDSVESNCDRAGEIMQLLKSDNNGLQERLASFYFKSGDNGMPWGKWNPEYIPVGIVR